MVRIKDLTERTLVDRWSEVKDEDEWWGEVKDTTGSAVKRLLEDSMEEELLRELGASKYRRTEVRRGYRNGYRSRGLLTELGSIEGIRIPRDRDGDYHTQVIPRY